jgi:hypothetical protein
VLWNRIEKDRAMGNGAYPESGSVTKASMGDGQIGWLIALLRSLVELRSQLFWRSSPRQLQREASVAGVSGLGERCID